MLSGLFRSALPLIRRIAPIFGKRALATGLNIANDMVEGSSFKDSASKRIPDGIKGFMSSQFNQSGSGKRRRHIKKLSKKKRKKDIFD